jgi:hypothetical protein
MLALVRVRTMVALGGAAVYVALLAHTTGAVQCPAREPGACAKIHAQMMATRFRPADPLLAAVPMRAPTGAPPMLLAAVTAR